MFISSNKLVAALIASLVASVSSFSIGNNQPDSAVSRRDIFTESLKVAATGGVLLGVSLPDAAFASGGATAGKYTCVF